MHWSFASPLYQSPGPQTFWYLLCKFMYPPCFSFCTHHEHKGIFLSLLFLTQIVACSPHTMCVYLHSFALWFFSLTKISTWVHGVLSHSFLQWPRLPLCECTTVYFNQYLLMLSWLSPNFFAIVNSTLCVIFYVCRYAFRRNSQKQDCWLKV